MDAARCMMVIPKSVLVHGLCPLSNSTSNILGQHKPPFSVYSIHAWWISWRMETWIFNNSANMREDNVYSFYYFLLTREVVPVLPAEESYISSDACSACQGSISCSCPGQCLTENRRKVDVCSLFQIHFSFLTVCQRRREHYDFSNYSKLPGFLVALRAKTLEKQNPSWTAAAEGLTSHTLDNSHLAHFSLSPTFSCTCSFPLINQKANTLPWILSECATLSVRARGTCQSWFCCFMYALCLFHPILEFHGLKTS